MLSITQPYGSGARTVKLEHTNLSLAQLYSFREAAREGAFSRAAARLSVTQPCVSNHVRMLEEIFGVPLFMRTGKAVKLTAEGQGLLTHVQAALQSLEDALAASEELRGVQSGTLVVGAATHIGIYMLPTFLGEFTRRFPRVEVTTLISNNRDILKGVLGRQLDLGFVVGEIPGELVAEPFLVDEYVLIVCPGHPLAGRQHALAGMLADERFVMREEGSGTREFVERQLAARGITPRRVMMLGSTEAIKQVVAVGLGVSIVSKHTIRLEVEAGLLVALPIRDLSLVRQLFVVYPRARVPSRAVRAFLDVLRTDGARPPIAERPA
jgi:DNA-binding transcriptional LysR family regulator